MNDFLSRAQAARYISENYPLPRTGATLAREASQGKGPRYIVAGNRALYRPADLDAWAQSRIRPGIERTASHA